MQILYETIQFNIDKEQKTMWLRCNTKYNYEEIYTHTHTHKHTHTHTHTHLLTTTTTNKKKSNRSDNSHSSEKLQKLFKLSLKYTQTTAALTRLKPVWNDSSISLSSKIWLMRSHVTSIFLYACESWTLTAELQRRIQAIEMRSLRMY